MGIASEMRELTHDIAVSHEDRTQRITETKGQVQDLVTSFQTSRKQAGVQLRKDLAQETAHRESQVKGMMKDARQTIASFSSQREEMGTELRKELVESRAANKSEIEELLKNLKGSRQETGNELRRVLRQGRANRESAVKEMRNNFGKARAEIAADLKEAAAAWQGLVANKATVKVIPKAETAVREETPDLEAKLLAAINKHPEGITLTEVADRLGIVPIVLGRASRSLLEKGKIRKEDKLYFPAAGS